MFRVGLGSKAMGMAAESAMQGVGVRGYVNTVINIVNAREAWVVERLGKFHKVLEPGLSLLIPFVDVIRHKVSLKEVAVPVRDQRAITRDNVLLELDGVLYYQIVDPMLASYGVEDVHYALLQLAESTMRSEIGKMTLDRTFEERTVLNEAIVTHINDAAAEWGVVCKRYEIRDITPPDAIVEAMKLEVAAERRKRATILDSEGVQRSRMNVAEGQRMAMILESEGHKAELINSAKGKAEAIIANAEATAASILMLAKAVSSQGGHDAVSLKLAEEYVHAFGNLAQNSTTMLLPADANDVSSMVAKAVSVFSSISSARGPGSSVQDGDVDELLKELKSRPGSVLSDMESKTQEVEVEVEAPVSSRAPGAHFSHRPKSILAQDPQDDEYEDDEFDFGGTSKGERAPWRV